ncbi:MAG: hypothetical protein GC153_06030 [Alphaproteobacteria bacterium]|nr:hypothetical protein [Alphaproteobacteria bacterium]
MQEIKALEAAAEAGDAAAQYRLAAMLSQTGEKARAAHWLSLAASSGHPGALYTRATELLARPPAQMAPAEAASMLERAAAKGGAAAAMQLSVLVALGLGATRDWPRAVGLLSRAAKAGHPAAARAFRALGAVCGAGGRADAPIEFAAIEDAARAFAPQRRPSESVHDSPEISVYRGLLAPFECAYVAQAARPILTPSAVVDPARSGAVEATYRTSDGATIGLLDLDLALIAIDRKLCAAVGVPFENAELMGVLRYRPGEEYKPHHDCLPEDAKDYSEVRRTGQRTRTLLVTLNENFEGGETIFPRLGVSFRGRAGDALLFQNADENDRPIPDSRHAGAPVTAGEKWMLTLWIRSKRFWFW